MITTKLQDRRVWIGGGAVIVLVLVAASWLVFIHPRLANAENLRSQASTTSQQNAVLAATNAKLARKFAHLSDMQATLKQAAATVPGEAALPSLTREINAIASTNHTVVSSLTLSAPTAVAAAVATTPSTTDETSSTSAPPAGSSTATTSAASATAGQYQISMSISVSGSERALLGFLHGLQTGSRGVLVSSAQLTASQTGTQLVIQASAFTAPMSADQIAELKRLLSPTK